MVFGPEDIIHPPQADTRHQALEDGVLVDVSETAREAGIRYPTAVTTRVWHELVVPNEEQKSWSQDQEGRLWDVLWMFALAGRLPGI